MLTLKELKQAAKISGRKISTKTVSFMDLSRDSKRYWYVSPGFPQFFSSPDERARYLSSLDENAALLFIADKVLDENKNEVILKG